MNEPKVAAVLEKMTSEAGAKEAMKCDTTRQILCLVPPVSREPAVCIFLHFLLFDISSLCGCLVG